MPYSVPSAYQDKVGAPAPPKKNPESGNLFFLMRNGRVHYPLNAVCSSQSFAF
jgi:hypothetical protein